MAQIAIGLGDEYADTGPVPGTIPRNKKGDEVLAINGDPARIGSQPDFDTMTDAELADYQYTHRDDPLGDEADLHEVDVDIAHPLSVSLSFRLPPKEASAIRAAAERAGLSMSDWIRGVCATAAEGAAPVVTPVPRQRVNMAKARRLVAELDKELQRAVEQVEPSGKVRRSTDSKGTPQRTKAGSDLAQEPATKRTGNRTEPSQPEE